MHFTLPALAALIALASALPTIPTLSHVVHEKRRSLPEKWTKRSRMDASAVLPVRVGLKQRNLEHGHRYLDAVSNPFSKSYGKHWSVEDITETFAPSDESTNLVLQWLSEHGISTVRREGALHTLEFDLSVAEVESLLNTEYFVYEHDESGEARLACEDYSVPAHISDHINIITPTLHFDVKPHSSRRTKRDIPNPADPITGYHPYHEETVSKEGAETASSSTGNSTGLQSCLDQITPDCLRALYNIPQAPSDPHENNSFGILEFSPNSYSASDLDKFFKAYEPAAVGARPELVSIHGATLNNSDPTNYNLHGESNLDFQYAMALTYPQNITLYQFKQNNDVSDANFIKTKVLSVSWGYQESALTPKYMETICNEYMKLGLQGISILYSTSDYGVGGNEEDCPNGVFQPDFPASCPYITAVGATQLDANITDIKSVLDNDGQPEVPMNSFLQTAGGFSNVFPIPNYQKDVVQNYLKKTPPPYSARQFNNSGAVRAFPDISANGHNYQVFVGGAVESIDGTSAATPLFASMITMINDARLKAGKPTLGFLNPAIYSHAEYFVKDVTKGDNPGCGTNGFDSAEGWDPVTGLGTPDYPSMFDCFTKL